MAAQTDRTDSLPRMPSLWLSAVTMQVVDGPDRGMRVVLQPGITQVGTAPTCSLRLGDPSVSRVHCELRVDPERVRVFDLGSTNGTRVDGVDVRDAALADGSTLRLGATTLRVHFGETSIELQLPDRDRFGELIGKSVAMRRLYALLDKVAPTSATVLLRGETGTGKEMVARAIHQASSRASGPFVAINCGAISENLIESELFGHVRGAFSGANTDRRGLFEEAHQGTLFLDEIGELPPQSQPKLLRVLETREVRPVGGNTNKPFDVRLIAATNRPLAPAVNKGTFREDLYYRLAVVELVLPALRERLEDVPLLARHFNARITGRDEPLSQAIIESLAARSWPGNVRELKNFVERSATLGWSSAWAGAEAPATPVPAVDGLVRVDLPIAEARALWSRQFESLYLSALLRRAGENVTRAAEIAGISRRSMHRLLAEHRLRGARAEGGDDDE